MSTIFGGPPSPEEFQRQLSDFVRQHFQNARGPGVQTENAGVPEAPEPKAKAEQFEFNYKPREVKAPGAQFLPNVVPVSKSKMCATG